MMPNDNEELLSLVRELESHEFEEFVAALWELQGWTTEVTGQSGDRGTDIIAKISFPISAEMHIQAKRYGKQSSVSGPEMQKYGSLTQKSGVDIASVVTSGKFTSQAASLAEEFNIKLVSGEGLDRLIRQLNAEELLIEYLNSKDSRSVDLDDYASTSDLEIHSGGTHTDDHQLVPSPAVASGDWLRFELVGAEWQSGYLKTVKNSRVDPIDGLVLAFDITNTSDQSWSFTAQNINSGGGAVSVFDSSGFCYEAVNELDYTGPFDEGEFSGWNWDSAKIRPQARARVATWIDAPRDSEIMTIEYDEKVWRGFPEYSDHQVEESITMSFNEPVEKATNELPSPIKDSIS
jgi:hypothetical protein